MPYNFEEPRYYQSNVEPGSLGIRIAGLVMQGANQQKSLAMERERLDIAKDRLKQQALDDAINQQELAAISEITSTFPTSDDPLEQNKWLSENAGKLMKFRNGPQVLSGIDRMVDNNLQIKAKYGLTELATQQAKDAAELVTKWGASTKDPDSFSYARQRRSTAELFGLMDQANAFPTEPLPEGMFFPDGSLNHAVATPYINRAKATSARTEFGPSELGRLHTELDRATTAGNTERVGQINQAIQNYLSKSTDITDRTLTREVFKDELSTINAEMQFIYRQLQDPLVKADERTGLLRQLRVARETKDQIREEMKQSIRQPSPTTQAPAPAAEYPSAEAVKKAFVEGKLTQEDAMKILRETFGFD